ncbi:hypothetical protein FD11_GL002020 [Ligilactobacillus pobuzihii E100301 = KCTC 13174]|uniref:Uncharacterized protein n=1 Tax=Ligilactobacillus pobuzihii TaxID=449659 RepID=A0A0R2LL09_9LACO|nr:hypothetical protein FD11_GL002020 [Ligilactobacillus pobuzihii E100301 = KCTC 13174]KRO02055.1 hypothetical protein IV66_GL001725 [Ligilactobacillus pobuzihii]GEN48188.1 hypothetical protein LPO01_09800 [Ligilactobacillus pobuzihii]
MVAKNSSFFDSFVEGRSVKRRVREILRTAQVFGHLEDIQLLKDSKRTLYYAIVRDERGFKSRYKVDLTNERLV